jgi:hypothetical protein
LFTTRWTVNTLLIAATDATFPALTTLASATLTATNDEFLCLKNAVVVRIQFRQRSNRTIDLMCRQIAVAVSIKQAKQPAAATLFTASTLTAAASLLTLSAAFAFSAALLASCGAFLCTTVLPLVLLSRHQVR